MEHKQVRRSHSVKRKLDAIDFAEKNSNEAAARHFNVDFGILQSRWCHCSFRRKWRQCNSLSKRESALSTSVGITTDERNAAMIEEIDEDETENNEIVIIDDEED